VPADQNVLELQVQKQPDLTIVRCKGRVVLDTSEHFAATLRHLIPEGRSIRVDLAELDRVDSVGIGTFVNLWTEATKAGVDLKFCNPNRRIRDVLDVTMLYDLFE
jgi:anti-anti-sigma factor